MADRGQTLLYTTSKIFKSVYSAHSVSKIFNSTLLYDLVERLGIVNRKKLHNEFLGSMAYASEIFQMPKIQFSFLKYKNARTLYPFKYLENSNLK